MARTPAVFSQGVIPASIGVIAGPVPSGERWYVTRLDAANTSGTQDVDVTFYLRTDGSNNRLWQGGRLDQGGGFCELIDTKAVLLEAGDTIMARASLAGAVTYYAAGIRES